MFAYIYRCPNTGLKMQSWIGDEPSDPSIFVSTEIAGAPVNGEGGFRLKKNNTPYGAGRPRSSEQRCIALARWPRAMLPPQHIE